MTIYNWLCLLGVPAVLAGVFAYLRNQIQGVRLGVKALLRAQMIACYNKWHEDKRYAPIYVKQNFENCWEQYHRIKGPNGVMDDLHDKFMQLPTEPI